MSEDHPDARRTVRQGQPSVFLERETYRRRRLMDAARLLPLLGVLLFLLPLLWPQSQAEGVEPGGGVAMSDAIIYIFSVWVALIVAIGLFGRATRTGTYRSDGQGTG